MAMDKPYFGWGLESYASVFSLYNVAKYPIKGGWRPFYAEAHNDWLQSLAEVGFVGTTLLVLLGWIPILSVPWRRVKSVFPHYLLAGCGLLALYAWLEFPFANPSVLIAFWGCIYGGVRYAQLDSESSETSDR